MGEVLFKLLISTIADVGQAVSDTDDLVPIRLSFHQRNEINIAVRRDGAPNAGPHQDHTHEIASATATDVAQRHRYKLFESRLIDRVRLFRRLRHRQELRLQFF
jgi:hypothetical protein